MSNWIHHWPVNTKLRTMTLLGIAGLLALAVLQSMASYRSGYEARENLTRSQVESALGIVKWAHGMETSGKLKREEAQQMARAAIATMRYQGNDYFWINDMTPRVVMHPIKPELEGKEVSGLKDPHGKALFLAFVDKVRKEQRGFVDYMWPKPGHAQPVDKLSFVQGFEPWGWVLGSGIYIDDLKAELRAQLAWVAVVVGVLAVLMLLLSRAISRSIVRGLDKAKRVARAMAEGDLGQDIRVKGSDDVGQLMTAMRDMVLNVRRTVQAVQAGAQGVEAAAAGIAAGNGNLSARTEQQAAALEDTASSMEQLSATVQQNADSARQANELAHGASTVAARGGEVVGQVVATMKGINDSSRRIADIIGVIDGIAFQTNILALNAAVEAARAGDQGRGFAVVASEVRNLAQRSAEAAREIKALITASVERVEEGTQLVDRAGNTMTDVVHAIKRVTDIMGDISEASEEQSRGVAQVSQAITQMDQATSQNAALVADSATAAQALRAQAHELVQSVSAFRLAGAAAGVPPHHQAVQPASAAAERQQPQASGRKAQRPANTPRADTAALLATAGAEDGWSAF